MAPRENNTTTFENMVVEHSHLLAVTDKLKDLLTDKVGHHSRNIINRGAFMDKKNGTMKEDNRKRIIHTKIGMVMSTTGTLLEASRVKKQGKNLREKQKNSLWSLKGNKENTTSIKDNKTESMNKE